MLKFFHHSLRNSVFRQLLHFSRSSWLTLLWISREKIHEDGMAWKNLVSLFWSGIWWNIALYGVDGWGINTSSLLLQRQKKFNFWYFRVTKSNDIDYRVAGSLFSVFNWIFSMTLHSLVIWQWFFVIFLRYCGGME